MAEEPDYYTFSFPVTVHPIQSPTRAATAYEQGDTTSKNALLFVGGLSDGPHVTWYLWTLAKKLAERRDLDYSIFEFRMRSSFAGFGASSLEKDVEDISAMVKHLRKIGRQKIILMGHSTGAQDCMEYTKYHKYGNEPVDGFILQAPISDRENLDETFPDWRQSVTYAESMIAEGKQTHFMPPEMVPESLGGPITAYRLRSLMAPGGDDDYFSTDLPEERVRQSWARFNKPVLVMHSENDEFVPKHIDQAALNRKYQELNPLVSKLSGVIPGAWHGVMMDEPQTWLDRRVMDFLEEVKG